LLEEQTIKPNYQTLLYEKNEGIGIVTLNRPRQLNALNSEVYKELYQLFQEIEIDSEVGAVIITGSGEKAFAAGTDIGSMVSLSAGEAHIFIRNLRKACDLIYNFNKPVIAAINGFALGGGCELAACADFRIASETAQFGQPEINLGIIPGSGGTQRLPRIIGEAKTKELVFTGMTINASTAFKWGLVNNVVPSANLIQTAKEMARLMLSKSLPILGLAKVAINNSSNVDISTGLDIEEQCICQCFATEDQQEGMKAFLEKRKPQFKNK
jgi:enoyl-CoA hydratase